MHLMQDENKILKEGQVVFQRKFEDIYENHILIAKHDGMNSANTNQHEEDDQKQEFKIMNNMQDEVRKLHFQLSQKDQVINKLKSLVKKRQSEVEEEGADIDKADEDLERII